MILFRIGAVTFAMACRAVHEIRSTDSLAGAAAISRPVLDKVRHTLQRARRTYYVVNAARHFGLPPTRPGLVLILRNSRVAVLVDGIECMSEISSLHPLPAAFCGSEREWYSGLALAGTRVIPVVNPAGFLSAEELRKLEESSSAVHSATDQAPAQGAVEA